MKKITVTVHYFVEDHDLEETVQALVNDENLEFLDVAGEYNAIVSPPIVEDVSIAPELREFEQHTWSAWPDPKEAETHRALSHAWYRATYASLGLPIPNIFQEKEN